MTCLRCAIWTERFTATQRYCALCAGQVAAIEARLTKPAPEWLPTWRREPRAAKDMTGHVR